MNRFASFSKRLLLSSALLWTYTTGAVLAAGPNPVVLGAAANYVIFAKSGISTVPTSAVTGNLGVSPIDSTAITGFSLSLDPSTEFSTSSQVTGQVFAAEYSQPTPANLTTAVSDMATAYTDAAGRAAGTNELGAGNIGGLTLVAGVYKWSTGVTIPTNVTLSGGPNDVWIFQIAGDLSVAAGQSIILSGGAVPNNIFWQVAGGSGVTLGVAAHLQGIVLAETAINLGSTASVNGRLFAQTAVNLSSNSVTQPVTQVIPDVYAPLYHQLTIPSLRIGYATYSNVVLTIGSVLSGPSGTTPNGTQDSYNPANNELTVQAVKVGSTTYYNVVCTVAHLVSIGSVSGADTFYGTRLTIPYVQVGAKVYHNVVLSVTPTTATVAAVNGGMPSVSLDQYNASAGKLTVPAVQFGSKVYTNVILNAQPSDVLSVGAPAAVPH